MQAVADGRLNIVPDRFSKVYDRWLTNIRDWCISRQLWWGHRIPVWYVFSTEVRLGPVVFTVAHGRRGALTCLISWGRLPYLVHTPAFTYMLQ